MFFKRNTVMLFTSHRKYLPGLYWKESASCVRTILIILNSFGIFALKEVAQYNIYISDFVTWI